VLDALKMALAQRRPGSRVNSPLDQSALVPVRRSSRCQPAATWRGNRRIIERGNQQSFIKLDLAR
jgi:hypothetical protein